MKGSFTNFPTWAKKYLLSSHLKALIKTGQTLSKEAPSIGIKAKRYWTLIKKKFWLKDFPVQTGAVAIFTQPHTLSRQAVTWCTAQGKLTAISLLGKLMILGTTRVEIKLICQRTQLLKLWNLIFLIRKSQWTSMRLGFSQQTPLFLNPIYQPPKRWGLSRWPNENAYLKCKPCLRYRKKKIQLMNCWRE